MATRPLMHALRMADRRRARSRRSEFDALAASPQDLGAVAVSGTSSALTVPAGARLALSCSTGLSPGDLTVNVGSSRDFSHPALSAGQVHRGYWIERDEDVTITRNSGPAGTATLYVVDPLGRNVAVATATLS